MSDAQAIQLVTEFNGDFKTNDIATFVEPPKTVVVNHFGEADVNNFRAQMYVALRNSQPVIPVIIHSDGGSITGLFAMIDVIREVQVQKPVATICSGKAFSAGLVLLAAGSPNYRFAEPGSWLMLHDASAGTQDKVPVMANYLAWLERLQKQMLGFLDQVAKQAPGYFDKIIEENNRNDVFLDAYEALQHGLVDRVGSPRFRYRLDLWTTFE